MKKFIIPLVTAVAVVSIILAGCVPEAAPPEVTPPEVTPPEVTPPEVTPPKTVNIGALFALTGPASAWGLPGLTGLNILIDDVNAAGGLRVGDERYLINLCVYDDEGIATKAVLGAKKLVFEDDVKMVTMLCDPPISAAAPFFTEHKVLMIPISVPVAADRPYLIAGHDPSPRNCVTAPVYVAQNYDVKRVAIVVHDDLFGQLGEAHAAAGWKSQGVDIVYRERFAVETTDFAPVMSAILATNPDVIDLNCTYCECAVLLVEQAYLQGFDGIFVVCDSDLESTLAKVPVERLVGRYFENYPMMNDPMWGEPSPQHDFYRKWMAKYGPGAPEDVHRIMVACDWMYMVGVRIWIDGVEAAGTFDTESVIAALKSIEEFPTLEGTVKWNHKAGLEMFGIDNLLESPFYVTTPTLEGERICVSGPLDFSAWYAEYGDILLGELEAVGLLWWQR